MILLLRSQKNLNWSRFYTSMVESLDGSVGLEGRARSRKEAEDFISVLERDVGSAILTGRRVASDVLARRYGGTYEEKEVVIDYVIDFKDMEFRRAETLFSVTGEFIGRGIVKYSIAGIIIGTALGVVCFGYDVSNAIYRCGGWGMFSSLLLKTALDKFIFRPRKMSAVEQEFLQEQQVIKERAIRHYMNCGRTSTGM